MNIIINYLLKQFQGKILPNQRLIVAISGGQDSITLFILLFLIQRHWTIHLICIYCNHLWQYQSSQLFYHLSKVFFASQSTFLIPIALKKLSNEKQSREWRYTVLERVANLALSTVILTGHTSSDNLETILLNWIRGLGKFQSLAISSERTTYLPKLHCFSNKKQFSSFQNLLIKKTQLKDSFKVHKRQHRGWQQIFILRPLLGINRYEVYNNFNYWQFPIWVDPTNYYLRHGRNRIRYQILPCFRFYLNSSIDYSFLRSINNLSQELRLFEFNSFKQYKLTSFIRKNLIIQDIVVFLNIPYVLKKKVLFESLREIQYNRKLSYLFFEYLIQIILLTVKVNKKPKVPQILILSKSLIIIFFNYKLIIKTQPNLMHTINK